MAEPVSESRNADTGLMTGLTKPKIGRPSKGARHRFSVKLDLERASKLMEILRTLNINGIDYLTPIVAAHLDSIDLDALRGDSRGRTTAAAKTSTTSTARTL